jgi:hypothetical protein
MFSHDGRILLGRNGVQSQQGFEEYKFSKGQKFYVLNMEVLVS